MSLDIFSDASECDGQYAGAYIIGRACEPCGVLLTGCHTSIEAELLTTTIAIRACLKSGLRVGFIHTDLLHIDIILQRARSNAARDLRRLLFDSGAKAIVPDAWNFAEYHLCHHRARAMAGINGTKHPFRVKELRRTKTKVERELKGGLEV